MLMAFARLLRFQQHRCRSCGNRLFNVLFRLGPGPTQGNESIAGTNLPAICLQAMNGHIKDRRNHHDSLEQSADGGDAHGFNPSLRQPLAGDWSR